MKRPVLPAASVTYWRKFLGVVGGCLLDTFGNGLFFSLIHFDFFLANIRMEWPMFFPRISFVFYGEVLSDGVDQLYFSPPKPSFGSSIHPKKHSVTFYSTISTSE